MARYDKLILSALLDSYEKSSLFTGTNKTGRRVIFRVEPGSIPEYFEEGSLVYEEVHGCVSELVYAGLVTVIWRNNKEGGILEKVILNTDKLEEAYKYLRRIPRADLLRENIELVRMELRETESADNPVCKAFLGCLLTRMEQNQSVKAYITLQDIGKTRQIISCVKAIEQNVTPCYVREFSIRHFHDSKTFEDLAGVLTKIFHDFGEHAEQKPWEQILSEYEIYKTPNYVYFKGDGIVRIGEERIMLRALQQGIGISGEDIERIELEDVSSIKKVITIENLTTFFRWTQPESLILYLGGYHNSVRRRLLRKIYEKIQDASYLHFGDIDLGGFEIYEDLCLKTGIPFKRYRMDLDTLTRYEHMGKRLTENDRERIKKILRRGSAAEYEEVLRYMLEKDVKLEQECVEFM